MDVVDELGFPLLEVGVNVVGGEDEFWVVGHIGVVGVGWGLGLGIVG